MLRWALNTGLPDPSPGTTTTSTLAVSGLGTGAYAANAFSANGYSNPAGSISSTTAYGTTAKYLEPTNHALFALTSTTQSRDQEVTTWIRAGYIALRLSGGKCILFSVNEDANAANIRYITGLVDGTSMPFGTGTFETVWSTTSLSSVVAGYDPNNTAGQTWTFGAVGFDIYLKYNGTEFLRFQDFRYLQAGVTALGSAGSGYGFRDVTSTFWPTATAALYSSTFRRQWDLRDFHFKTLQTTGSISASGTSLVLASNPGFAVGDHVIVELGGEAGAGARGTVGVGGSWPPLSYANTTAMNADTSKAANTYAFDASTGTTYMWTGSAWSNTSLFGWYQAAANPLALKATITAVSGTTLTLDTAATVAATSANVYFDNAPRWNDLFGVTSSTYNSRSAYMLGLMPIGVTMTIPSGSYAFGTQLSLYNATSWTVAGQGNTLSKLFSPKGATAFQLSYYQCTSCNAQDYQVQGNARQNGYWVANPAQGVAINYQGLYTPAHIWQQSTNCNFYRIASVDNWYAGVGSSFSTNCSAYNCALSLTDAQREYIQWQYEWSDSTGGTIQDCTFTAPYMTPGWETFRSSGVQFIRCTSQNGAFSSNSSGNWLLQDISITITAHSQYLNSENSWSSDSPIVNINSNIQPPNASMSLGGTILRPTIIQQGYRDTSDTDIYASINVNQYNPNVYITGTYPDTVNPKGYVQAPAMSAWNHNVKRPIRCDAMSTGNGPNVNGIRVVAPVPSGDWQIAVVGTAQNCVADSITATTTSNNQNNATWIAAHP